MAKILYNYGVTIQSLADVTTAIQMLNESSIVYIPLLNCPSLLHQVSRVASPTEITRKKISFCWAGGCLIIAENPKD